jgi:hypothetical protein
MQGVSRSFVANVGGAAVIAATVCGGAALCSSVARAQTAPAPWSRTETRAPCSSFNVLRTPYFGETHSHTGLSIDAVIGDDRSEPREAYTFAKGGVIDLPPYDASGKATRSAQLRRPLDFAAVTDHAEGFDLDYICKTSGTTGNDSTQCKAIRADIGNSVPGYTPHSFFDILLPTVFSLNPQPPDFCKNTPGLCPNSASVIWTEEQDAAEAFYDRTAACAFTTFVAYEWSGTPNRANLHRNVIFRNTNVPALPISYIEEPTAEGLWAQLQKQCLDAGTGCDVLAIPHNSNLSNGLMFEAANTDGSPLSATDAATRAAFEPLVEIIQHKGDSECKIGVGTTDELCGFEKVTRTVLFGTSDPNQTFPPLSFVRNALKQGLLTEQSIGVNPFKLGFVGATDTHNATPGQVDEDNWQGHQGTQDGSPAYRMSKIGQAPNVENNPGGLAVVWAEENSRDALFAAMRRREVYATSGTRPIVRAFAGKVAGSICKGASFAATGYQKGVPMGGEIGPLAGNGSPGFAVLAMKDPGTADAPGTPLQRIQIVKGWIDDSGQVQEKVFDITKKPNNGATVDTATCETSGPGADSLCAVWKDRTFKSNQRAFYYARVLENPTCRWSTRICNDAHVDCSNPAAVPADFAECCDAAIPKTIQERAWTSPFWYEPEGIGKVSASIAFGKQPGADVLKLSAQIGAAAPAFNPDTDPVTLTVRDDDDIYQVTIPAGTMTNKGGGKYQLKDKTGALGGLKSVMLKVPPTGLRQLVVQTVPMDLPHADRVAHMVEIDLSIGSYQAQHTRLWMLKGTKLQTS